MHSPLPSVGPLPQVHSSPLDNRHRPLVEVNWHSITKIKTKPLLITSDGANPNLHVFHSASSACFYVAQSQYLNIQVNHLTKKRLYY